MTTLSRTKRLEKRGLLPARFERTKPRQPAYESVPHKKPVDPEAAAAAYEAAAFPPEWLGGRFRWHRKDWELVGLAPERSQYPVLARRISTGVYRLFSQEALAPWLCRGPLPPLVPFLTIPEVEAALEEMAAARGWHLIALRFRVKKNRDIRIFSGSIGSNSAKDPE